MSLQRALRSITRPLAHAYSLSRPSLLSQHSPGRFPATSSFGLESSSILARFCSTSTLISADFSRLTESRFPKRRPGFKNRKKRASLRPPGPYAWVKHVPGEPIQPSQPNEGSINARRRNEKKRIKQHKLFVLSEKKKRKAQWAEARKRKDADKIERKMAQVAREKAWAERLVELQQLELAKKEAASIA
ncbi:protein translocase subunit [Carex rostrata]